MKPKKLMSVFMIFFTFSFLVSCQSSTTKGTPSWETVFDPAAYISEPYYFISSLEEFKGDLYAAVGDPNRVVIPYIHESIGQVFRSSDGKNWEPASEIDFGLGIQQDGCGDNSYDIAWDMAVFKGDLYLEVADSCFLRPGVILRSSDGKNWTQVASTEEFGLTFEKDNTPLFGQFKKFGVFKDMLYVDTMTRDPATNIFMATLFRSSSGDPGTWEKVFDFPGFHGGVAFHNYKGALYYGSDYVFTASDYTHGPEQIWRTTDGKQWENVVSDGFGNPASDSLGGFAEYKGYLYVGDGVADGEGSQIWRSQDGVKWEKVDISSMGESSDEKVDGLVVFQKELYAYTLNTTKGGSVFRTRDAVSWDRVSEPGWGNPLYLTSHLESDQVVFKNELYLGVIGKQGVLLKLVYLDK